MKQTNLTHYRWLMLGFCCVINLCIGSIYAWSVLSVPMAKELGVESLSGPFAVATSINVITMIIGGILNDRFGPRWVMFAGGIMFGSGMFLSGSAQSVTSITLTYGVILGLGSTLIYGCTINNTIKFFPDRRGMVGGITTAFYGISSVLIAPVANIMCIHLGIRDTFHILGICCFVIICAGSFLMKKCPADFVPDEYQLPKATVASERNDTPFEMLKRPIFYVMLLIFVCGSFFGMMVISSAQSIALNMVSVGTGTASLLVSVLCIFNTAGRLVAGTLSDRFGRISTLLIASLLAVIGLVALLTAETTSRTGIFTTGMILIGISFGTFLGVYPGFCADQFGTKYNTVNYGIMWLGYSIAGLVAPMVLSSVYEQTGLYRVAFMVSLVISITGAILIFICRRMLRRTVKS